MHSRNGNHAELFGSAMNPSHLRTFLSVAQHLNYTHAAKKLLLSQPAVSRQVRQLEKELGVALFEQIGKSLHLTDPGKTLATEAERMLGDIERVAEAVRAHCGPGHGSLRIGASTTPGFYLVPAVLGRFHAKHPQVELSYTIQNSLQIEEKILKNELDLGFVGASLTNADLHLEPVSQDEIVFFASPSHPLARGRRIELKALEEEMWVIREKGSATRQLLETRLQELGGRVGRAMVLQCPEAVKAVVAGGFGFSFLSAHGLRDDFRRGRLQKLPVSRFRLTRPIYAVHHSQKVVSPVMETFLNWVKSLKSAGRTAG